MFICNESGFEDIIPKGTHGLITNIDVDMSDYNINYPNFEITYGKGERTLLNHNTVKKSF